MHRCYVMSMLLLILLLMMCMGYESLYTRRVPAAPETNLIRPWERDPLDVPVNSDYRSHRDKDPYIVNNTQDLSKRAGPLEMTPQRIYQRQVNVFLPTIVSAASLKDFWQQVTMDAALRYMHDVEPKSIFTFSQGRLHASFSCLGGVFPWQIVHSFAERMLQVVERGNLDTFDAVYEYGISDPTYWISFKVS